MDEEGFRNYLRKGGRSENATNRCIRYIALFDEYLNDQGEDYSLEEVKPADIIEFVNWADNKRKKDVKVYLWAIRYYFEFLGNEENFQLASALREERIDRKPFLIKDFSGVDPSHVEILQQMGIRNITHMLKAGADKPGRIMLAKQSGIPEIAILEFVKLSDLARIPGVKGIRARLYYEAGIDTVEKIAVLEPQELRRQVVEYVNTSNFDGVPTYPAEAEYTVQKAKELQKIVEY